MADVPECYPPLRLNVCPRCEYALSAHPPQGVCPECGRAYDDAEEIVLYGYATSGQMTGGTAKAFSRFAVAVNTAFVVGVLLYMASNGSRTNAAIWLFVLVVSLSSDLWRRLAAAKGLPLLQVKLTPRGFRQGKRGLGPCPFERNDAAPLHPWSAGLQVRFNFIESGRVQVVIAGEPAPWLPWRGEHVNAEVAVEPGQLQAIRGRIAKWLGDASRAQGGPPAAG